MKKTWTVNLNGHVFNIDEDAYTLLNHYLEDLGRRFGQDEREEIMKDIEARIAELFSERLQDRYVVEIQDVREVISTLGDPSQFEGEDTQEGRQTMDSMSGGETSTCRRKLYRDIQNKRIGGVAAGLAAYMDWDVTIVRLLFVLLLLISVGWGIFIYMLMWIFIPEANSVGKRLEMQGKAPTAENIRNHATEMDNPTREEPSTFVKVLKVLGIILLCVIGFALFCAVLGLIMFFISTMCFRWPIPIGTDANSIIFSICVTLFLLCPAIAIVMFCVYLISNWKPRRTWVAWTLLGVWLVSLIGMCVTGVNAYHRRFHERSIWRSIHPYRVERNMEVERPKHVEREERARGPMLSETRDSQEFNSIVVSGATWVNYTQGDSSSIQVKASEKAMQRITTEVRDGVLYIGIKGDNVSQVGQVEVTSPNLRKLAVSDASHFEARDSVQLDRLDLEVSDASEVNLMGRIDVVKVQAKEDSKVDLQHVYTESAEVIAEEASHVDMGEVRDLRISSSGSSQVTYQGRPQRLIKQTREYFEEHW